MCTPQLPDPDADGPMPRVTPTADAAERWLRRRGEATAEGAGWWPEQVSRLLDDIALYLSPDAAVRRRRAAAEAAGRPDEPDEDAATLAALGAERNRAGPAPRTARFDALTACRARFGSPSAAGRACAHTHVELLVGEWPGPDRSASRYGVRVVNVDAPRSRHRDAFIAPETMWPDRALAVAAGLRLARERWGDVAVVFLTPPRRRPDDGE